MGNEIGEKIKALRTSKDVTLKELGDAIGMSAGYLSQVERGKSSIAINRLAMIADYLDTDIRHFVSDQYTHERPVMRSYENQVMYVENDKSFEYRISTNIMDKQLLPKISVLLPGFSTETAHSHEGEEFIYILEGTMILGLNDEEYEMYPGDTAHYSSQSVHKWENNTTKVVRLLVISTPNHFAKDR